ncbi:NUDIX domain-containing protein [Rhodohalobacter halophilus]|uniref:NUDIX domain-containing protein n=1 Tax=Rhodohalobacter halophilus TaxID=1812810 RepID=UPI0015B4D929|nr:NUDIX domain-containing protein [Rhodohalobacter halophilus]
MISQDHYSGKLRVRACGLLVKNRKILLVNQKVPTRDHPVWLPPGGGVHTGETAEESVIRECKEETNLEINDLKLRYVHEFIQHPIHAIELYFSVGSYTGNLENGFDPEHPAENQLIKDVQFIPLDGLKSISIVPDFLAHELLTGNFFDDRISYFKTHES